MNRRAPAWASIALAALATALSPAAASAAVPVATDESVAIGNPTTVPLEATVPGATEMSFAIASSPSRGTLGPISSPSCQPTGSGGTDCKATVIYTPNQCTNGPDSFTYTATNTATMETSGAANVTLSPGSSASGPPPAPSVPLTGAAVAGVAFGGTVQNALAGATVDYGDGSGAQPLAVDTGGGSPLSHVYGAEGSYTLTATNHGSCGMASAASERVDVLPAGGTGLATAAAAPGNTASVTVAGPTPLTATLTVSPTDPIAAFIAAAAYAAKSPLFALAGPAGPVVAAYDIRTLNASANDSAVVVFTYADGGVPTAASVLFFDPALNKFVPVHPSTLVANAVVNDVAHRQITIVLDRTSQPTITALTGTRFAVVGHVPAISRLAVTPRCASPTASGSLRLRFNLSQRATLAIRVRRSRRLREPRRCRSFAGRVTPAGNRQVRIGRRLRPGVYTVQVLARNVHGRSRVASTTFAVADG